MNRVAIFAAACAAACSAVPAAAATYVVNAEKNLLAGGLSPVGAGFLVPLNLTVAEGDTVDLRLDFTGAQELDIAAFTDIIVALSQPTNMTQSTVSTTTQLSFFDPVGNLKAGTDTLISGAQQPSTQFFPGDITTGAGPYGFSGLRAQITINDYGDDLARTYGNVFILISGTVGIGAVNGVPEPATWAMMIAGFGLVGGAMRRRPSVDHVNARGAPSR